MEEKKVSKSVLKRLPGYLAYLKGLPEDAPSHISATSLANALGMGEVQVRKDLAIVSDGGRPKIGYLRESLITDIEQFLGYDNTTDAVLIGAGKLGLALMGYSGFEEYGLNIHAAFDTSPTLEKTEDGQPIEAEQFASLVFLHLRAASEVDDAVDEFLHPFHLLGEVADVLLSELFKAFRLEDLSLYLVYECTFREASHEELQCFD